MTRVTLTESELRLAVEVGVQRRMLALRIARKDRGTFLYGDYWGADIEGACGEMVIAKLFGIYWSGDFGNIKADDVGRLQVRTTGHSDGHLLLHEWDKDDRPYILVTGSAPTFKVVGWIMAADGKRQEWWKNPSGKKASFWVPQAALRPMSELPTPTLAACRV